MRYNDRYPVVEAYLSEAFPGATVYRLDRAGDPQVPGFQPHQLPGELWRAETPARDYNLGITDEALEDLSLERLAHALRYNDIRKYLEGCSESERLWLFTGGVLTKARLGEAPA
jgi:hypothetical protein